MINATTNPNNPVASARAKKKEIKKYILKKYFFNHYLKSEKND